MSKRLKKLLIFLIALIVILPAAGYFYQFGRPHTTDPQAAEISFESLVAFAELHDESNASAQSYQRYFEQAEPAVKVWQSQFGLSAKQTAEHYQAHAKLYEDLEQRFAAVAETEAALRASYTELKRRYPDARLSPLRVFFGGYTIRSLIKPYGILFAGEYFSGMPSGMDVNSPAYLRGLMAAPHKIVTQTIHEQAHIQQARNNPLAMFTSTVLERAIYEGTAELVGELITGEHNAETVVAWVAAGGDELWCSFYQSLERPYRDRWIDSETFGRPVASTPVAFGLPIARAYFETFDDPDEGLKALLELSDSYEDIYKRSGWDAKLRDLCSG